MRQYDYFFFPVSAAFHSLLVIVWKRNRIERNYRIEVLMRSIAENPDLHKYVKTKGKGERSATLATLRYESII